MYWLGSVVIGDEIYSIQFGKDIRILDKKITILMFDEIDIDFWIKKYLSN